MPSRLHLILVLLCLGADVFASPLHPSSEAPFTVERLPGKSGSQKQWILIHDLPPHHNYQRGDAILLRDFSSQGHDSPPIGWATIVDPMAQSAKAVIEALEPSKETVPNLRAGPMPEKLHIGKEMGTIVKKTPDGRVQINIGDGDGVEVGDRYDVLGPSVTDADLWGRSLGRDRIGQLKVVEIGGLYALAETLTGQAGIGNFVRRLPRTISAMGLPAPEDRAAGQPKDRLSATNRSVKSAQPSASRVSELQSEPRHPESDAAPTRIPDPGLRPSPTKWRFPTVAISIAAGAALLATIGGISFGLGTARYNQLMTSCQHRCSDEQVQSVQTPINIGYSLFALSAAVGVSAATYTPYDLGLFGKSSAAPRSVEQIRSPMSELGIQAVEFGEPPTTAPSHRVRVPAAAKDPTEPVLERLQNDTTGLTGLEGKHRPAKGQPPLPLVGMLGGGAAALVIGIACGAAALSAANTVSDPANSGQPFNASLYATQQRGLDENGAAIAFSIIGGGLLAASGGWLGYWLSHRQHPSKKSLPFPVTTNTTGLILAGR